MKFYNASKPHFHWNANEYKVDIVSGCQQYERILKNSFRVCVFCKHSQYTKIEFKFYTHRAKVNHPLRWIQNMALSYINIKCYTTLSKHTN